MFLNKTQLEKIGLKSYGRDVYISDKCSIYNPENIEIGHNVRIDDFCILSAGEGGIVIGSNIHIACYTSLIGKEKIELCDYSGVGARCSIYSSSDDFSGDFLVGPTIKKEYTNVKSAPVKLSKYGVLGCGVTVLPGVTIAEGAAVGSMSLVKKDLESYKLYAGIPCKLVKSRSIRMTKFVNPPETQEIYLSGIDMMVDINQPYYGGGRAPDNTTV